MSGRKPIGCVTMILGGLLVFVAILTVNTSAFTFSPMFSIRAAIMLAGFLVVFAGIAIYG